MERGPKLGIIVVLAIVLVVASMGFFLYFSTKDEIIWSKLKGDAISVWDAEDYLGEEKIVEGKIVNGYKSDTNTVFLNFGEPYPNHCFSAVIFSSDLGNFPENPQDYYEGKLVRVKGVIKEYEGKPEIILKDITQIEIGK